MPIGFLSNDQEFEANAPDAAVEADDLDFRQMWRDGLESTSVESRSALAEYERTVRRG